MCSAVASTRDLYLFSFIDKTTAVLEIYLTTEKVIKTVVATNYKLMSAEVLISFVLNEFMFKNLWSDLIVHSFNPSVLDSYRIFLIKAVAKRNRHWNVLFC